MGQAEIARALGEARGPKAREALVGGLALAEPRARAAVAGALGRFREDETAAAALPSLLERERARARAGRGSTARSGRRGRRRRPRRSRRVSGSRAGTR